MGVASGSSKCVFLRRFSTKSADDVHVLHAALSYVLLDFFRFPGPIYAIHREWFVLIDKDLTVCCSLPMYT